MITAADLLAAGYREFPVPHGNLADYAYQKPVRNTHGRLYTIFMYEYEPHGECPTMIAAQVCCDTSTGGHAWMTFREDTLELVERRAEALWRACGGIWYEGYGKEEAEA